MQHSLFPFSEAAGSKLSLPNTVVALLVALALSSPSSATVVGEIVFVGGQCPGGFIPLDGREIDGDEYPELAAVLNTDVISLPVISPLVDVDSSKNESKPVKQIKFFVSKPGSYSEINPIDGPVICTDKCGPNPGNINGNNGGQSGNNGGGQDGDNGRDLGSIQPQYCIATGGDTPPLVEIGLEYAPGQGSLEFVRVNVSGYNKLPDGFREGDIDIGELRKLNPGIGRPNISFVLVGENVCVAKTTAGQPYPGELRMSGVQISKEGVGMPKDDIPWGDDWEAQSKLLERGEFAVLESDFAYSNQRDEAGRPGFLAVDIIDDRKIILETRNINPASFQYRVQAQCGDPGSAYNVYFDPSIRGDGTGGGGSLY